MIVCNEATQKGALNEGWLESHTDLVGMPTRYKGKIPDPAVDEAFLTDSTSPPVYDDPEGEPSATEDELLEQFKAMKKGRRPLRNGVPTSSYLAWKKQHGYR